jgi:hypothetical protein
MKSTTVSVMLGPWEWGPLGKPHLRYFSTAYEAGWARRDSRKHRNMVQSEWYQALWPMALTKTDEANFENEFRGGRMAVPFNRLTAGRGNRLTIDDPHSVLKAESETQRDSTTRLFRESAQSRLNDPEKDAIIVMMQRLHPNDLCGVIEELGLPYVKLVLPMEYNRSLTVKTPWFTDPRTEEGELLFPAHLGREKTEELKIASGPHAWDTQYQQQPRARAGSYFFSRENVLVENKANNGEKTYAPAIMPKRLDAVFCVLDTASKAAKGNDGQGVIHFGFNLHPKPHGFILDYDYVQMEGNMLEVWLPTVLRRNEELARLCNSRAGSQGAWIEDKDSGIVLLQKAKEKRWRAKPLPSDLTALGKNGRAVSVSGYVYTGLIKMTQEAYDKTVVYKGRSKNHCLDQVTTFRMNVGTPSDDDELFDCFCYGASIMFGDSKGA